MSKFNFYFLKYLKSLDKSGTWVLESLSFITGTEI